MANSGVSLLWELQSSPLTRTQEQSSYFREPNPKNREHKLSSGILKGRGSRRGI